MALKALSAWTWINSHKFFCGVVQKYSCSLFTQGEIRENCHLFSGFLLLCPPFHTFIFLITWSKAFNFQPNYLGSISSTAESNIFWFTFCFVCLFVFFPGAGRGACLSIRSFAFHVAGICCSVQSVWGRQVLSTSQNQPSLKALIRKFGWSILPEMAELIIGFQLSVIQSITTAINHSACNHLSNAPLVLKCFLYSLFPLCLWGSTYYR